MKIKFIGVLIILLSSQLIISQPNKIIAQSTNITCNLAYKDSFTGSTLNSFWEKETIGIRQDEQLVIRSFGNSLGNTTTRLISSNKITDDFSITINLAAFQYPVWSESTEFVSEFFFGVRASSESRSGIRIRSDANGLTAVLTSSEVGKLIETEPFALSSSNNILLTVVREDTKLEGFITINSIEFKLGVIDSVPITESNIVLTLNPDKNLNGITTFLDDFNLKCPASISLVSDEEELPVEDSQSEQINPNYIVLGGIVATQIIFAIIILVVLFKTSKGRKQTTQNPFQTMNN